MYPEHDSNVFLFFVVVFFEASAAGIPRDVWSLWYLYASHFFQLSRICIGSSLQTLQLRGCVKLMLQRTSSAVLGPSCNSAKSFIWLLVTRCHTFASLNAWVFPTPDDKHESEIIMFVFRPFSVFSKSFRFATDCDTILCSANMFHRVFLGSRIWKMQFQGCVVFYTMHCFVHPGSKAPRLGCKARRLS